MRTLICFIIVSLMIGVAYAGGNSPVVPQVSIISPQNDTTTNQSIVNVTISFKASASPTEKAKTTTGNITHLILKIDNNEVSRYENPPNIKEGSHTFSVDVSGYSDSIVSLQAFAYQGNVNAGLVGESNIVSLIIDRTPPIVNVTLTPQPNAYGWNNSDVTVHFDATDNLSGVVSVTPDITLTQEVKEQVVTGNAQDKAGNIGIITVIVNIDKTLPQIAITSPAHGTTLDTNTPLIRLTYSDNLSGINLTNLSITINGINRTSEFTIGDGEVTLQIISNNPLPDGQNTILANIQDKAGNISETTSIFTISTIKVPPITPESGFIHGQVFDAKTNIALEGAEVTLQGIEGKVFTDSQGRWTFPTPTDGDYFLTITKQGYNYNQRHVPVISGRDIAVEPAYLLSIDVSTHITVTEGGAVTNTDGTMEVIFPPGALPHDEDISLTLIENSRDLPDKLPDNVAFVSAFYGNPSINFNEPVKVRIKNRYNFAANLAIPIGFWNRQEGKWEARGMGKVSSDGKWLEGDWTGFSSGGFFFGRLPPPQAHVANITANFTPDNVSPENECSSSVSSQIGLKSGSLLIEESFPSIRSLGISDTLNFTYNSSAASPSQIIATETNVNPSTTITPQRVDWELNIEGNLKDVKFDGVSGGTSQRYLFDGKNRRGEYLKTGSYPYDLNISNEYTANFATTNVFGGLPIQDTGVPSGELVPLTTTIKGRTIINNQIESPYGSGWGIGGIQRLHIDPDGAAVISEGDGSAGIFTPGPFAYVPSRTCCPWMSKEINVIDTNTNSLVDTIPLDYNREVNMVGISPDGRFLYVMFPLITWQRWPAATGVVIIYDTANDFKIIGSIDIGNSTATGIAFSPDGNKSYLTINGFSTWPSYIYTIDTTTYNILAKFRFDFYNDSLLDITISNDGSKLYVIHRTPISYDLLVINTETGGRIATIPIDSPQRTAILPDGSKLYITVDTATGGSPFIAIIDTMTNALINTIPLSDSSYPQGIVSSLDGSKVYVGTKDGIIVIDSATDTIVNTISLGGTFFSLPTLTIGGKNNYLYASVSNMVIVIDTATDTEVTRIPVQNSSGLNIAISSTNGIFLSSAGDFSSLIRNDDNTYTRTMKDGTKINFNSDGLQTSTIDRNGNVTTYEYTDANNDGKVEELNKITLPTGQTYTFSYNANGKFASVTDPAGRATQFTINPNGNLTQIVYPDGSSKSFTYDANHQMLTQTDQRGNTTEYIYDKYGKIKETKSPTRDITSVDVLGNVTITRSQEIHQFQPQDIIGLINDIPEGEGTPDNPAPVIRPETVRYTASEGCNCAGTNGQTDKFGSATNVTDALGRITSIERDIDGNPTKITRPNGAITSMSYDIRGNLLTVTEQSISATTTFTYESTYNQVTSIKDPQENTTTISYDGKGNPTIIKDTSNNPTALTYDNRGLLTSVKDALNDTTTFTYDPITGNLTSTQDPLGNTTTLTYDTAGNVITSQDAEGRMTTFSYDSMNRLISVTDADSKTTQYQYDLAGNLIKVIDAKFNQTQFIYNEVNQLIQTINPSGRSEYFQYDANRNIATTINRNGDTIAFGYDLVNQLIKKYLPGNQVTAFNYDNVGNLSGVTDPDSVLSFTYDLANRLTSTSTVGSPYQPAVTLNYGYDKNGNRTNMIDPQGVTNYVYDTLNRLTTLTNPQNKTTTFGYDNLSRRRILSHANGTSTTYNYDIASQLTSLINTKEATTISRFDYTYDRVGNRITMPELAGVNNYGYDILNRLISATHPQPENPAESFAYDAVGNRLTSHLSNSYTYDIANRLLEDNTYLYTYDDNGNMTEKIEKSTSKITRYYYDAENQLIAITLPDDTLAEYRYDGLSRRIEKKITLSAGPITATRYIYDNEDILLEYDATNTLIVYYTHGPGIDEPLIMRRSGVDYYYHVDGLGSVKELTDAIGSVIQTYTYDTFGKIVIQIGTITNPYTYTSREYDPESGLYYYRARYYDPTIGRFITKDPLGFIDGPNLYLYLSNDPVTGIDPWGLARLRVRPLEAIEWTTIGPLQHEQFFYEDGKNSGYFPSKDKEGGYIGPDTSKLRNKYKTAKGYENLDDEVLRQAEKNIGDEWLKEKFGPFHDCQAYRRAAMKEYNKLMKEKKKRAKCN